MAAGGDDVCGGERILRATLYFPGRTQWFLGSEAPPPMDESPARCYSRAQQRGAQTQVRGADSSSLREVSSL
jgi:hypothetical protein